MFGGSKRTETDSSMSPNRESLQMQPTAATSVAGQSKVMTNNNSQGVKQTDLFATMQDKVNSNAAEHLRFSNESMKNIQSANVNTRVSAFPINFPPKIPV